MTLVVAYSVEHGGWGDVQALCERAVAVAFDIAQPDIPAEIVEVSLVLSDDATVQNLNREWRDKDSPTNVLSFPAFESDFTDVPDGAPVLLGDIILAYETCVREAGREQILVADHLTHLVVHGFLHLLGYDHQDDDEAEKMEALEITILAKLGIENPYKEDGSHKENGHE